MVREIVIASIIETAAVVAGLLGGLMVAGVCALGLLVWLGGGSWRESPGGQRR